MLFSIILIRINYLYEYLFENSIVYFYSQLIIIGYIFMFNVKYIYSIIKATLDLIFIVMNHIKFCIIEIEVINGKLIIYALELILDFV